MQNQFLNDFIRRQAELGGGIVGVTGKKKEKKPKKGRPEGDGAFDEKEAFTLLVNEKPPKKDVLEYFKLRIDQLVALDVQ